jgi:hypothetical protein
VGPFNVGLRCHHEAHQVSEPLLMNGASLLEGEGLMAARLRAEIRTYLVEQAAEPRSRGVTFEPAHRPIPWFDPAMILLQMVSQVAIGPMRHCFPEHGADRAGVGVMSIRRDAVRGHAGACPRGMEEGLRRGEVAGVAEAHVHQVAVSINRPVSVLHSPLKGMAPAGSAVGLSRLMEKLAGLPQALG